MGTASTAAAPRTRQELRFWILSDLAAHGLDEWRASYRTAQPVAFYQVLRRRAEYWTYGIDHRLPAPVAVHRALVLRSQVRRLGRRLALDIPLGTTGPGLFLKMDALGKESHKGNSTINVHPDARLGSYCTLHPGVTIDLGTGTGRAPVLGDYCRLGNAAVVLGARLGDRVDVAEEAVVTVDCGDDACLAGQPARPVDVAAGSAVRRDGRRTTMTPEQAELAQRLHVAGMRVAEIADAFWVSPSVVDAMLVSTTHDLIACAQEILHPSAC